MPTLYEITTKFQDLFELLDPENTTDDFEDVLQQIEITEKDFEEKALGYCKFIQSEKLNVESIDKEIQRLQKLKKSKESKIDFLEEKLLNSMTIFSKEKIDLNLFKLSIRNSEAVEIDFCANIPDEYLKVKVEPDKKLIKEHLKKGEFIAGCRIIQNKSLSIR